MPSASSILCSHLWYFSPLQLSRVVLLQRLARRSTPGALPMDCLSRSTCIPSSRSIFSPDLTLSLSLLAFEFIAALFVCSFLLSLGLPRNIDKQLPKPEHRDEEVGPSCLK